MASSLVRLRGHGVPFRFRCYPLLDSKVLTQAACPALLLPRPHTHARTHARTHTRTHARTHAMLPDPDRFPVNWHPHRGMDILSYLKTGVGRHGDSMGNRENFETPGMQWISCGSGIEHVRHFPARFPPF